MPSLLQPLLFTSLACSAIPAALFCRNLFAYRVPPPVSADEELPAISILIPARNEEHGIAACLDGILANTGVAFEVLVMDDSSEDRTASIVREYAARDGRVRLLTAPPLPAGWNGKQQACWHLAQAATQGSAAISARSAETLGIGSIPSHAAAEPLLCFLDADVRLAPDCLARTAAQQQRSGVALLSGFPRQIVGTWLEKLLIPLIHFVLLAYLPIDRMRAGTKPAYAAGCGQFMLTGRAAYFASGGHAAIRATMHDGLLLPRLFRQHGYRTDLADITPLATCRMYTNARQVWLGLAKNATEGIAAPARIVPFTLLLLIGQVLPGVIAFLVVLVANPFSLVWMGGHGIDIQVGNPAAAAAAVEIFLAALVASFVPRLLAVRRFRQPLSSALLHPLGVLVLLVLQWYALVRKLTGGSIGWKQRSYGARD